MSKPKLTGWYPGEVKPVRKGVYMQPSGLRDLIGYQYWNGTCWGLWAESIAGATRKGRRFAASMYQNDKWRGLTEPSK